MRFSFIILAALPIAEAASAVFTAPITAHGHVNPADSRVQAEVDDLVSRFEDDLLKDIRGWGTLKGITVKYNRDRRSFGLYVKTAARVPRTEDSTNPIVVAAFNHYDAFWSQAQEWIRIRDDLRQHAKLPSAEEDIWVWKTKLRELRLKIGELPFVMGGPFGKLRAQLEQEGENVIQELLSHISEYHADRGETRFSPIIDFAELSFGESAIRYLESDEQTPEAMESTRAQLRRGVEGYISERMMAEGGSAEEVSEMVSIGLGIFDGLWNQAIAILAIKDEAGYISEALEELVSGDAPPESMHNDIIAKVQELEALRARMDPIYNPGPLNALRTSVDSFINAEADYWRDYAHTSI